MLAKLTIKLWSGRKFDRAVTRTATDHYGADPDAGRFNKVLVNKDEVKRYTKKGNEIRAWFYDNSAPWKDNGQRIIKNTELERIKREYRQHTDELDSISNDFCHNYESLKRQAALDLNGMFNPDDYPTAEELRNKFFWNFDLETLPILPDDFRTTLSDEQVREIRADLEQANQKAIKAANKDAWQRLYVAINHMQERLSDPDAVFRDSLINNICELCEILPRLNITEDPELEKMRLEAQEKLCSYDPENLRENASYRLHAAQRAKELSNMMQGYMG
jgi:hypothetical protein